jgi:hypothetical protein
VRRQSVPLAGHLSGLLRTPDAGGMFQPTLKILNRGCQGVRAWPEPCL